MGARSKNRGPAPSERHRSPKRSWPAASAISVAVIGLGIAISATVNPLLGRAIHWDWMAVAAPALFVALTVVLRNRWA